MIMSALSGGGASPGASFMAIKKGSPERVKELLRVMNFLAAPFGSQEFHLLNYGVKDVDYDTVGAALLWTLQQGLGPAFTPEVKSAWTTVYGLLASTMKAAAQSVAA